MLDSIIAYKARWLRWAGAAFFGGSLLAAVVHMDMKTAILITSGVRGF